MSLPFYCFALCVCVCVWESLAFNLHQKCFDLLSVVDADSEDDFKTVKQHGKWCFLVLRGCDLLIKEIMFYSMEEEGEHEWVYGMCVFCKRMGNDMVIYRHGAKRTETVCVLVVKVCLHQVAKNLNTVLYSLSPNTSKWMSVS